jgi:hypothetical protein
LKTPHVNSVEELRRLLVKELLAEQATEKDARRREALIHLATPFLRGGDVAPLAPLLNDRDEWLRRVALAALIDATRSQRYVALGAKDLTDFLAGHDPSGTISDGGETYGTEWRLFDFAYGFLGEYRDDARDAFAPFLPLYRVLAAHGRSARDVERLAVGPLAALGTKTDVPLLFSYCDSKSTTTRWQVRQGIGRILGLKLSADDAQADAAVRRAVAALHPR